MLSNNMFSAEDTCNVAKLDLFRSCNFKKEELEALCELLCMKNEVGSTLGEHQKRST